MLDDHDAFAPKLARALRGEGDLRDLRLLRPRNLRDKLATLLTIYELHVAPIDTVPEGALDHQHDPVVSKLKLDLEAELVAKLDHHVSAEDGELSEEPVAAMREIAKTDLVPPVYDWVAERASLPELVEFLAVEGGPDGGFDDLVAVAQVGLSGRPKVTLGANYWDEMGRGNVPEVHTELHQRLVQVLDMPRIPTEELPVEALERSALNGLLATNRALQPEMIGALGLLEIQAGPRCRRVVAGLTRLGAPADALPFYEEHATADPRHGKEWLDHGIAPLVEEHPEWGPHIVRGARWRSIVNRQLFEELHRRFEGDARAAA